MTAAPRLGREPAARVPAMKLRLLQCFPEVHEKVLDGIPLPEIATFIQGERGEYTEISHESLVRTLTRYRDSLPPADLLATRLPKAHREALAKTEEGVHVLHEAEGLFRMQMARVAKLYEVEQKLPHVTFPNLTTEIRQAESLLATITQIRKATGLPVLPGAVAAEGAPSPEAEVVALEKHHGPEVGRAIRSPESVHRVISLVRTVTTLARIEETRGGG